MTVNVFVMPRANIRHPESECIKDALQRLSQGGITKLKKGKIFIIELSDGRPEVEVLEEMKKFADKYLANFNIEDSRIEIAQK